MNHPFRQGISHIMPDKKGNKTKTKAKENKDYFLYFTNIRPPRTLAPTIYQPPSTQLPTQTIIIEYCWTKSLRHGTEVDTTPPATAGTTTITVNGLWKNAPMPQSCNNRRGVLLPSIHLSTPRFISHNPFFSLPWNYISPSI